MITLKLIASIGLMWILRYGSILNNLRTYMYSKSNILKKLYKYNCRNLLIEGGDSLTSHLLKNKIFNKFYLYKSPKNLSKKTEYLKFNSLDILKKNYKNKFNLKLFLGKDKITLYKN